MGFIFMINRFLFIFRKKALMPGAKSLSANRQVSHSARLVRANREDAKLLVIIPE
jgi:hypothetical protein